MAYESVLNVTPTISGAPTSTLNASGLSATFYLTTTGTTLYSKYPDLVAIVNIATSVTSPSLSSASLSAVSLSASSAITNTLSVSSVIGGIATQVYLNTINYAYSGLFVSSLTPNGNALGAGKVVLGLGVNDPNFRTTALYLSATSTANSIAFDTTQTSTFDNLFYYITNPALSAAAGQPQSLRTTYGQSRLASYLG
jgi:hypothetical protein